MGWTTRALFTVHNLSQALKLQQTADSHIRRGESALQRTINEVCYKSSGKYQGEWCKMVQF